MPPRKPRQRQNYPGPSQLHQVQVSDYDTDTPISAPPPPSRTIEELNLTVLRRYVPSIQRITSLAASAYMYTCPPETKIWGRLPVEGTLFVCELLPSPTTGAEDYCVVILNRKGLNNEIINLSEINDVEIQGEFVIYRVQKADTVGGTPVSKLYGIFIHDGESGTRAANQAEIVSKWQQTRAIMTDVETAEYKVEHYGDGGFEEPRQTENTIPVTQAEAQGGRRLSITDLFGGR